MWAVEELVWFWPLRSRVLLLFLMKMEGTLGTEEDNSPLMRALVCVVWEKSSPTEGRCSVRGVRLWGKRVGR